MVRDTEFGTTCPILKIAQKWKVDYEVALVLAHAVKFGKKCGSAGEIMERVDDFTAASVGHDVRRVLG